LLLADDIGRQPRALALAVRHAATQVGQGEIAHAIAAELRAQEREQRGVLADRQDLPLAQRPSDWSEVEREQGNLAKEWLHRVRLIRVSRRAVTATDTRRRG
jgi:hypothetical protein